MNYKYASLHETGSATGYSISKIGLSCLMKFQITGLLLAGWGGRHQCLGTNIGLSPAILMRQAQIIKPDHKTAQQNGWLKTPKG